MNTTNPLVEVIPPPRYQLKSIDVAVAPEGNEGTWFRYVIVQGISEITGLRPGSHAEVDFAVREMVDRLNERSAGKGTKKIKPTGVKSAPTVVS